MARLRAPWRAALLALALAAGASSAVRAQERSASSPTIAMPDGVALAADVVRPAGAARAPAILVMTRYGRATRLSEGAVQALTAAGLAVVTVDVRGSGASQGHVTTLFAREERADIGRVIDWIARQPWSDGRVITTGTSYDGNLAALALAAGARPLVAAVPRFIDFDTYRDLAVPGGVRGETFLKAWGTLVDALDLGAPCLADAAACAASPNLKPVDGDADRSRLRAALLDHQKNWRPYEDTRGYAFEGDVTPSGFDLREGFLSGQLTALKASKTPTQVWGSWFDGATADGALEWYARAADAPLELYIGAWTHGGGARVDPFIADSANDEPGAPSPASRIIDFVNRALESPAGVQRVIHYYTAEAAVWRTTRQWPPAGVGPVRWYLSAGGALSRTSPRSQDGEDRYAVDFSATTGTANRWTTQMGGGPVDYGDRRAADLKLLTYTSPPLAGDIEVTGAPTLALSLTSTHPDGAVFVYLEAVAPDGRVTYLTEGELRLPLRGPPGAGNTPPGVEPSFLRADMAPLVPGQAVKVGLRLHAVSAVVRKGWRLRIALAGADADNFARYPADGAPVYAIGRSALAASYVDLPQADWPPSSAAP